VLNQLGEVRMGQGNAPGARELFQRALKLGELAVHKAPGDPQMLFAKSQARYWIGHSLFVDGDVAGALVHMQQYQRDAERLAAMDPANRDYQRERAYGHGNVATMLENLGRIRDALPHHQANLEIKQRLHDGSDASSAELAVGNNKVGVALYRVGELGPSIDYLRREHDIYRALIARHPKDMRYKQKLATNMAYLARGLTVIGRKDEAAPLYKAELEIEAELAERDPTNVTLRRSVAMTSRNVAEGMARGGDLAGAERLIQSAQAQIAEAIRLAPTRTSFGVDAATIDVEYGRLLGEHGQNARALALIRGAIPRLETLEARAIVARAYFYEGEILRSSRADLAGAAYRRAEAALAPAMAKSTEPGELSLWTRILIRRDRTAEARAMLTRIRSTGQSTTDIEKLCDPSGC
jgi:tetratricopeptide (TPR) repeat protein